jgi:hypothetical protein
MFRRSLTPAGLVCLGLVFFWPLVLHPQKVLYSDSSDALAEHLPNLRFLARSWQQTGEIPLWCPHSLGGIPFIHDPQVSIFYPPNLLLLPVPDRLVGAAFSWLIVLQIIAAGLFAYAYARDDGLGQAGAFVAGAGYMLSGKWLLHLLTAGQTVVIGLAWLPLILLCFERAIRRRSLWWAACAGGAAALLILGTHPQWTLYAAMFIPAWTLPTALVQTANWRERVAGAWRWIGLGLVTAMIALALASIQLLPTLEAGEYSCRRQMGVAHADLMPGLLLSSVYPSWLGVIGPSLVAHPDWEGVAGLGLIWVMAAAAGTWLGGRKLWPRIVVCIGIFAFGLGGGLFLQNLPIFSLFRGPSRMLLLAGLPIAMLAGYATELVPAAVSSEPQRRRLLVLLVVVAAAGVIYTEFRLGRLPQESRGFRMYWPMLAITVPAFLWLASSSALSPGSWWSALWCAVLVADLLAFSWPCARAARLGRIYPSSPTLDILDERRADYGRILDMDSSEWLSPLGAGAPVAVNHGFYAVRGDNPMDFYRYKTYLRFISGTDEPRAPHELVHDFPLTHRPLLDLLGVRYLLVPTDKLPEGPAWRLVFQDSAEQVAYNYPRRGIEALPPYSVYENEQVMPRAFVAPRAAAMPVGQEREAMQATDFHETVLVEGCDPAAWDSGPPGTFRTACIVEYWPNQVCIEVEGGSAGWLVLTDMWFPGWTCTVNGKSRPIFPGNYLFRAVPVPAGRHEVVFRFRPQSYHLGRAVSGATLVGLVVWSLILLIRRVRSRSRKEDTFDTTEPQRLAA